MICRMTYRVLVVAALSMIAIPAMSGEPIELALWGDTELAAADIGKYEGRETERPNRWLVGVEHPVVSAYKPKDGEATGAAVVVFPGGGYAGQAIDKEGHYVAQWLANRGVVAMVVPYRCGGGEHAHPVPLADAKRAVRLMRSHAAEWGVDPAKIGVMGFSAGGHLAASASTLFDASLEGSLEGIDDSLAEVSARPDFSILVYPVISMRPEVTHGGSGRNLLGESPGETLVAQLSADEQVTAKTPPALIVHSIDDGAVPVANAQRYYEACRAHDVPVEMHLYETGGHGYGMWATEGSVAAWPAVLEGWLVGRGLATAAN
jgi:acetyl esterase/lipase